MNSQVYDWAKWSAIALCGMLAVADGANSQSTSTTHTDSARTIGPFSLSLDPFWVITEAQTDRLRLRASGDTARTRLIIESAQRDGADLQTPQAQRAAVLAYLCQQENARPEHCGQGLQHNEKLVTKWQLAQGKTVNGDDAWLGQRKRIIAGQATQLVTLIIANQTELLAFNLSNERSDDKAPARHSAQQALGRLVRTLSTKEASSQQDRWPAPTSPVNGFFATIGGSKSQASFSAHRRTMGISGLRLASTGWFALSERGLDEPVAAFCDTPAQSCGRYTVNSGEMTTWRSSTDFEERVSFMRRQQWSFKREPDDSLLIGGERHLLVRQPEAASLDGRYRSARRSGDLYSETIFSFSADGQFSESGFTATSGRSGAPVSLSGAESPREGRFEVDGFTLTLNYRDESQKRLSLFLLGTAPIIEGSMYQRLREPSKPSESDRVDQ